MPRILPIPTALTAVVVCGVVHGLWTDRWASAEEPAALAARLDSIPLEIGDWRGEALEQNARPVREVMGHLYRRYVNRRSGDTVTVALVGGRPGPVSVHTPDACYGAHGYEVSTRTKYVLPQEGTKPGAEFWTAQFLKTRAAGRTQLRIFWAWSAEGDWDIPDNPRVAYARRPLLYKFYLIREMSTPDQPLAPDDPCLDVMRLLLPELQKSLFAEP